LGFPGKTGVPQKTEGSSADNLADLFSIDQKWVDFFLNSRREIELLERIRKVKIS
jgi:hypothetical protein